jgi:hypothetical protein
MNLEDDGFAACARYIYLDDTLEYDVAQLAAYARGVESAMEIFDLRRSSDDIAFLSRSAENDIRNKLGIGAKTRIS